MRGNDAGVVYIVAVSWFVYIRSRYGGNERERRERKGEQDRGVSSRCFELFASGSIERVTTYGAQEAVPSPPRLAQRNHVETSIRGRCDSAPPHSRLHHHSHRLIATMEGQLAGINSLPQKDKVSRRARPQWIQRARQLIVLRTGSSLHLPPRYRASVARLATSQPRPLPRCRLVRLARADRLATSSLGIRYEAARD